MNDSIPNYVNHIVFVIDKSDSMRHRASEVIKVVDDQVKHLARRSQELDQETRVTIYVFSDTVKCVVYDKDVLRLPSISQFYRTSGMTALIDATIKSQQDLALTPEIYGDHSFLTYIFTDGQENMSRHRPSELANLLNNQPDHWTVGVFVPDIHAMHEAKKWGFRPGNIMVWNVDSASGITEVGETIRRTTDAYMTSRSQGVRGTRQLFSTGAEAVNKKTVTAMGVKPLLKKQYRLFDVHDDCQIREFVEDHGLTYILGRGYYQLTNTVSIQPQKLVAVMEDKTGKIYLGREARDLIGLPPDVEVRVKANFNPDYTIFIQSTSVNRKLLKDTKFLWTL